jgi:F-type H+-transporting ATPase subunit b
VEILFPQILFQAINFAIIVVVLVKFLYKPIIKILEQRSQKVTEGIQAAEKNIKSQSEMDETIKAEMKKAHEEAQAITKSAKKDAEREASKIIEQAKTDAQKVLAKERTSLEATFAQDKKSLEDDFVSMVTQTTSELLSEYLSKEEQQKIVAREIKELKNYHFGV